MTEENAGSTETTENTTNTTNGGDNNKAGNDATSSTQPDQPSAEFISAWEEDRLKADKLAQDNLELRRKMAESSREDDDDLSMDEKVDKEIARREQFNKEKAEIEEKSAEKEVAFYEKTNPTFRKNKEAILKLAVQVKAETLKEAIDIFKKRTAEVNKKDKKKDTGKKQEKQPVKKSVEKKGSEDMSISDIYSANL